MFDSKILKKKKFSKFGWKNSPNPNNHVVNSSKNTCFIKLYVYEGFC